MKNIKPKGTICKCGLGGCLKPIIVVPSLGTNEIEKAFVRHTRLYHKDITKGI